jgi:hypothetical protein
LAKHHLLRSKIALIHCFFPKIIGCSPLDRFAIKEVCNLEELTVSINNVMMVFLDPILSEKLKLEQEHPVDSEGALEFWKTVSQSTDGFDWLPNHKPYTRSCELEELPLPFSTYKSYITLSSVDKPADDESLNLNNVSIFFIDLRARGMIK